MKKMFLKKFLIGTLAVVAFVVTANLALASYDFGSAILKVGSRGQYVTTLQNLVGATPVDGIFGPKTKAKVVAWQVAHGLTADGLFGNLSKAKTNETGTNFGAGCTNASGFSTTTGLACNSLNANTFPVGCTNASGFSTTTGFACSSLSAHTFPAGCTNASGFSTATGYSCLTGLPPTTTPIVRGGGSSGHHRDTIISATAIAGVTAPVTGATPVTTVTAGTGYTGTVTWSGTPSTFAGATSYTATITLTASSGYTLTGVTADQFTIAGSTSDTNPINSGVITAVFPATTLNPVTSGNYTTVGGNNKILITLVGGTFKAGEIDQQDFIFSGTPDFTKIIGATTFTRTSDTEVTITGIDALAGYAGNIITVQGSTMATQATSVTVVASTLFTDVTSPAFTTEATHTMVVITLTSGTFIDPINGAAGFTFGGPNADALAAGTFTRSSTIIVTITNLTLIAGTGNSTVLVKGATQATQAASVAAVASTQ